MMKRHLQIMVSLCAAWCFAVAAMAPHAAWANKKEHLVKAAFLYNFTKFVDWPDDGDEITICVKGSKDAYSAARQIEKRSSDQLRYRVLFETDELKECSLYYAYDNGIDATFRKGGEMENAPVLLVGMGEDFIEQGGMIAFVLVDGKIKLMINPRAVKRAGLEIDSQLLEIAYKVVQE